MLVEINKILGPWRSVNFHCSFVYALIPSLCVVVRPSIPDSIPANISLTNGSICTDRVKSTPFGRSETGRKRKSRPTTELDWIRHELMTPVIFLFNGSTGDFGAECYVAAGPGIAAVDGRNMSFSKFEYTPLQFAESIPQQEVPLNPVLALMQTDWLSFERSINLKLDRVIEQPVDYDKALELIIEEALWEGVLAMSTAMRLASEAPAKETTGIQRTTRIGVRRNDAFFYVLILLLVVWVVGMFGATAVLLRPTWTSSLDGYAAARMLLHQPDLVSKPEAWFADLEENSDMLEPFFSNQMRGLSDGLVRRPARDAL